MTLHSKHWYLKKDRLVKVALDARALKEAIDKGKNQMLNLAN